MKNRVTELFSRKSSGILSVFFTAGFPALDDTLPIAVALERAGADLIEIGIPFSDPIADGPTIQHSNKIALGNGMNLHLLLDQVKAIRQQCKLPIMLMGYLNPVIQYGIKDFVQDASDAGVDGVILPDMPLLEFEQQYADVFREANLCNTFLVAPTTSEERIRRIDAASEGFVYAVSASSTTGAKKGFTSEQEVYFSRLRDMKLRNPVLIGFGISDHPTYSRACEFGAGAIVGSAFISMLEGSHDVERDVAEFVRGLKFPNS